MKKVIQDSGFPYGRLASKILAWLENFKFTNQDGLQVFVILWHALNKHSYMLQSYAQSSCVSNMAGIQPIEHMTVTYTWFLLNGVIVLQLLYPPAQVDLHLTLWKYRT